MRNFLSWVAAFLVAIAALIGLIAVLNSRDKSGVEQGASGVTEGPGKPYHGRPPVPARLANDVRRGNVVVLYRAPAPPPDVKTLVPPGGRVLVEAGQSVVLARAPSLKVPLAAVSAKAVEQANSGRELRDFVDYWVGGG